MADDTADDTVDDGADEGEVDLASLNDEDLTAQMHDDLYDGLAEEIVEGTHILLERGWSAHERVTTGVAPLRGTVVALTSREVPS